jgi:hypothetical protein
MFGGSTVVTSAGSSFGQSGSRPGEHDEAYTWGRSPSTYLSPRQVLRLAIYRSKVRERCSMDATYSQSLELDGEPARAADPTCALPRIPPSMN